MSKDLVVAIADAGFEPPREIVWDGDVHRFATDKGRRYSKDGWYVAFDDSKGRAAAFGSWRDGSRHTWSNGTGRTLTDAEYAEIDRRVEERKRAEIKRRATAAERASRLYEQAGTRVDYSGYLSRKQITAPDGARYISGLPMSAFGFEGEGQFVGTIVPMRNRKGEIRSLQLIPDNAKQKKLFMKGGETVGCFHAMGDVGTAAHVLIAEGVATAQSAIMATGLDAVVAFSAGNLPQVADIIRKRNATATITILADDDEAGLTYAQRAANIAQAAVVTPGGGCNDFNDLHVAKGLEAVRTAILGDAVDEDDDESWRADLIIRMKDDGTQIVPCRVHNLMLILANAREFKGRIRFNAFSSGIAMDGKDMDDTAPTKLKARIEKDWIREKVASADMNEAILAVARESEYHPVLEWLDGLLWDGIERIPDFFSDYLGCPKDDYHMAVAVSLFVSAVARVYKPGCKVDTMVILESIQGTGKTSLWLALFGEWCAEVTSSLNDKDFFSGLRGVWCADFGELDQFSRAESTRIKQVITQTFDHYRPHYGRQHQRYPRQCIFVGGTNQETWQADSTGGRRFLPVKVRDKINVDAISAIRDQLWAEAVVRFKRDEKWWDIPNASEHQESSYVGDTWEEIIDRWLIQQSQELRGPHEPFQFLLGTILESALKIEPGRQTRADQTRAGNAMRRIGWLVERKRLAKGANPTRFYVPTQDWLDKASAIIDANGGYVPT